MKKSVSLKKEKPPTPKSIELFLPSVHETSKTRPSFSIQSNKNPTFNFQEFLNFNDHFSSSNQSALSPNNLVFFNSRNNSLHNIINSQISDDFLKNISSNIALATSLEKNSSIETEGKNSNNKKSYSLYQKNYETLNEIYKPRKEIDLIKLTEKLNKRFIIPKKKIEQKSKFKNNESKLNDDSKLPLITEENKFQNKSLTNFNKNLFEKREKINTPKEKSKTLHSTVNGYNELKVEIKDNKPSLFVNNAIKALQVIKKKNSIEENETLNIDKIKNNENNIGFNQENIVLENLPKKEKKRVLSMENIGVFFEKKSTANYYIEKKEHDINLEKKKISIENFIDNNKISGNNMRISEQSEIDTKIEKEFEKNHEKQLTLKSLENNIKDKNNKNENIYETNQENSEINRDNGIERKKSLESNNNIKEENIPIPIINNLNEIDNEKNEIKIMNQNDLKIKQENLDIEIIKIDSKIEEEKNLNNNKNSETKIENKIENQQQISKKSIENDTYINEKLKSQESFISQPKNNNEYSNNNLVISRKIIKSNESINLNKNFMNKKIKSNSDLKQNSILLNEKIKNTKTIPSENYIEIIKTISQENTANIQIKHQENTNNIPSEKYIEINKKITKENSNYQINNQENINKTFINQKSRSFSISEKEIVNNDKLIENIESLSKKNIPITEFEFKEFDKNKSTDNNPEKQTEFNNNSISKKIQSEIFSKKDIEKNDNDEIKRINNKIITQKNIIIPNVNTENIIFKSDSINEIKSMEKIENNNNFEKKKLLKLTNINTTKSQIKININNVENILSINDENEKLKLNNQFKMKNDISSLQTLIKQNSKSIEYQNIGTIEKIILTPHDSEKEILTNIDESRLFPKLTLQKTKENNIDIEENKQNLNDSRESFEMTPLHGSNEEKVNFCDEKNIDNFALEGNLLAPNSDFDMNSNIVIGKNRKKSGFQRRPSIETHFSPIKIDNLLQSKLDLIRVEIKEPDNPVNSKEKINLNFEVNNDFNFDSDNKPNNIKLSQKNLNLLSPNNDENVEIPKVRKLSLKIPSLQLIDSPSKRFLDKPIILINNETTPSGKRESLKGRIDSPKGKLSPNRLRGNDFTASLKLIEEPDHKSPKNKPNIFKEQKIISEFSKFKNTKFKNFLQSHSLNNLKQRDISGIDNISSDNQFFQDELEVNFKDSNKNEYRKSLFVNMKSHYIKINDNKNRNKSIIDNFNEKVQRFFEDKNIRLDFYHKNSNNTTQINENNESKNNVLKLSHRDQSEKKLNSNNSNNLTPNYPPNDLINFKKKFSQSTKAIYTQPQIKTEESPHKISFETDIDVSKNSNSHQSFTSDYDEEDDEIIKKLRKRILEHDKLMSMNFIYYNLKNIRTIAKEDFFIYLEDIIANNFHFYKFCKRLEMENSYYLINTESKLLNKSEIKNVCNFINENPLDNKIVKYNKSLKNELVPEFQILSMEDNFDYKNFFHNSNMKKLKMAIDDDVDENFLLEDPLSPLFDRVPIFTDHNDKKSLFSKMIEIKKQSFSKKNSSNFLTTQNLVSKHFVDDEDSYLNDNNENILNKIKDKLYFQYLDIGERTNEFQKIFKNKNSIILSKIDQITVNEYLIDGQKKKINNKAKIFEENNEILLHYFAIQKLGHSYLNTNKENFLKFCEEHRSILFGYFEDYYHEIDQQYLDFDGKKKKKITFLIQGLPPHLGKQFSNKSLLTSEDKDSSSKSLLKGAFITSRRKNISTFENLKDGSNKNTPHGEINELNLDSVPILVEKVEESKNEINNSMEVNKEEIEIEGEFRPRGRSEFGKVLSIRKSQQKNLSVVGSEELLSMKQSMAAKKKTSFLISNESRENSFKNKMQLDKPSEEQNKMLRENSFKRKNDKAENELHLPNNMNASIKFVKQKTNRAFEFNKAVVDSKNTTSPKIHIESPRITSHSSMVKIEEKILVPAIKEKEHGRIGISEKESMNPISKNSMIFNAYMIHLNKKKNMNVVDQFFFSIKEEKFNELEELFVTYPNIFIDLRDDESNTMIINAVRCGSLNMVNLILTKSPNLNIKNNEGNTALHYSLAYGHDKITNVLLRYGASESIKNNDGKKPWDMVEQ